MPPLHLVDAKGVDADCNAVAETYEPDGVRLSRKNHRAVRAIYRIDIAHQKTKSEGFGLL